MRDALDRLADAERQAACRARRRDGLTRLSVDVRLDALLAHMVRVGLVARGERPSRRQVEAMLGWWIDGAMSQRDSDDAGDMT